MNVDAKRYGARTRTLMWIMLAAWAVFGFAIHVAVDALNLIKVLGFPLGYYMAAQGSLIAFVILLLLFAWRQEVIDRQEGVSDD